MHRSLTAILLTIPAAAEILPPQVLDANLKIELIAAEPEINTPVGIAVDAKGRLFVVENNTHQVKPDYKGPKSDRIRLFQQDAAGKWSATTFAEGFRNAMCLEFDPDGVLHLTLRDKLLKLEDTNGDGVCDKQTELMRWETKGDYPHNGLSGMTWSPDGWIYVGSGENLMEKYTAVGADGKRIDYQPGGANIFRLKRDGSGLEICATGLWNGFGLECDGAGRILAVDNDPDSCPPNRLLHIVPGGDYGYNMTYGRAGTHPFQCWNGEIPGTLPMVCGVGEAATDVLDMRRTSFRKPGLNVMVTSWGDNQIEAYKLVSKGASVTLGERSVLVRGDAGFRPACMSVGPDGSVFFTDWADREYSVHGKGRIWKLSSAKHRWEGNDQDAILNWPERFEYETWSSNTNPSVCWYETERIADPFVQASRVDFSARYVRWKGAGAWDRVFQPERLIKNDDLATTLSAESIENPWVWRTIVAARRAGLECPTAAFRKWLDNVSSKTVRLAIILAAERRLKELKPDIEAAMKKHSGDREVFRTGIAALELIEKDAGAKPAGSLDGLMVKFMTDAAQPAAIRGLAMLSLQNRDGAAGVLMGLLKDKDPAVAAAAARSLGAVQKPFVAAALHELALSTQAPVPARLEALGALSGRAEAELLPLLPLLQDEALAAQAVRTLRSALGSAEVRAAFEKGYGADKVQTSYKAQLALALGKPSPEIRPGTDEQWHEALRTGKGDPDGGRRVFFSAAANCATCHIAEGRGVKVGPDLSTIARSSDRAKLVDSILQPSREIGPLYVMKTATLKDGRTFAGVQSDKETGGRVDLIQPGGKVEQIPHSEVKQIDVAPVSLMPEGLEIGLTVEEFRDLVAYLESLK